MPEGLKKISFWVLIVVVQSVNIQIRFENVKNFMSIKKTS